MITGRTNIGLIPDCPRGDEILNKNKNIHTDWKTFFDRLILTLQTFFKNEGFLIPDQPAATIAALTAAASLSNVIYDSTNNNFNGNVLVYENASASPPTFSQIWLPFVLMQNYAGNPNTKLAGNLYQLCLDTTNLVLYVCTTTGDASSSVWTEV